MNSIIKNHSYFTHLVSSGCCEEAYQKPLLNCSVKLKVVQITTHLFIQLSGAAGGWAFGFL